MLIQSSDDQMKEEECVHQVHEESHENKSKLSQLSILSNN